MKNVFTLLTIYALCFLSVNGLQAQDATIRGTILSDSKEGVPYAVVQVDRAADASFVKGSIADENGAFLVEGLAEGKYTLTISSLGFETLEAIPVELAKNEQKELGVLSTAVQSQQLEMVEVISKRPVLEMKTDMTVLNLSQMLTDGKNSLDALKFGPGVVIDDIMGSVSMNNKSDIQIMVNGKLLELTGNELIMYLKSIPANSVDRIELITNPSARYDAAATGGIINIRLKRNQDLGTKFFVEQNLQQAVNDRWNTTFSFNHQRKKLNVYGSFYYSLGDFETISSGRRFAATDQGEISFKNRSQKVVSWDSPSYRAGADYRFNDNHTIGILSQGFWSKSERNHNNVSEILDAQGVLDSTLRSTVVNPNDRFYQLLNANYRYEDTTGQSFNFDVDYGVSLFDQTNSLQNTVSYQSGAPDANSGRFIDAYTKLENISAKTDWVKPFRNGVRFETGLKIANITNSNDFQSFLDNSEGPPPILDSLQTNLFDYDETLMAAYVSMNYEIGKFGFQAGLRGERTRIKGVSTDLFNNKILRPDTTYFNLFPSLFVTYKISPAHKLRFSYSRRIFRPYYSDLNPFLFYDDPYTITRGNPFLSPQYSNSFELTYILFQAVNISASYSYTNDLISDISFQDGRTITNTKENINRQDNLNFNFSAPTEITDWWGGYLWVGVYANLFDDKVGGEELSFNQWGLNSFLSQT
ncbi:MAG: TonB-dependent receptor, partial [Bacteroidota bacterium]